MTRRLLRLLGFDTQYRNIYEDAEIVNISVAQKRIILTWDRRLLFANWSVVTLDKTFIKTVY